MSADHSSKGGRPTLYRDEYCDELVKCMASGFSLAAFAGEIGVARDTLTEWQSVHPEFSAAVKIGQAARTLCLERTLLAGETGPKVTAHIFALKNAAPDEWRDKQEIETKGTVNVTIRRFTDEPDAS